MDVCKDIEKLGLRDFIRVYLFVNERFAQVKKENANNVYSAMYAVKNPEIVKEHKRKYYNKSKDNDNKTN
jgi:hypothetical protein